MDISDLAEKYFKNQASPDEVRTVLKWFKTTEGLAYLNARLDVDLDKMDDNTWLSIRPVDTARLLQGIYEPAGKARLEKSTSVKIRLGVYWKVAACFAFIILSAAYFLFGNQKVTYTTKYGQKKEIVLPDNSKVILNGNSSLTLSRNWTSTSKREVWLAGEAFFNVFHTKNHQEFVVYTSQNFNIQVLGTAFNVANRENITKVALERGHIRLHFTEKGKDSKLSMVPGELVEFNEKSAYLIKKETSVQNIASWKTNFMVFEQTSMKEIAEMLRDTYGLTLIMSDPSIMDHQITGKVPNENLDLFLKGLMEVLEVKIKREDNLLYLTKQ